VITIESATAAKPMADPVTALQPAPPPDRREMLTWHGGWAVALFSTAALVLAAPEADLAIVCAVGVGLIPTIAAFVLPWRNEAADRTRLLALWAAAAAIACVLTGGVSGPLAAWCLTPVAAAAVLGGTRPLAQGAALAFASAAAAALLQAAGAVSQAPAEPLSFALGLLSLATTGLGLGAALIIARRRQAAADRLQAAREAALAAARRDAEASSVGKSRFLANMSHELRTPLNAIIGFSDVMRQKLFGPLPGRYAEYADLIHDAGNHLLDLINDILDLSKIEAERYELSKEALDAREPVSAALRLMRLQADAAGVGLRGVLPGEPLWAEADERALKQIALNLLSNAVKFTPRGGQVTVMLQAAGGLLALSVADTGPGIDPADLERLGRPYEQSGDAGQRARGSGLGLSLVRAFSELHGGGMTIESQLGKGTTVSVRLPVLIPAPEAPPAPPLAAAAEGGAQIIAFSPQR
jgi:cell cycle sensor histidine kinase DivJ